MADKNHDIYQYSNMLRDAEKLMQRTATPTVTFTSPNTSAATYVSGTTLTSMMSNRVQ